MQLTKHTDFALRCLMYLGALPADELATITEISERFLIPRNHLTKVVNQLSVLGYVHTIRGPKGGMRLEKASEEIKLDDLIRDFEARLEPVNCDEPECPVKGKCELKRVLDQAQKAFLDVLKGYSLADLVKKPDVLIRLVTV